jgi:hypothetical protein
MANSPLETDLRRYGRRVRGIEATSGLGWAIFVAALVTLAGAWADLVLELTPTLRLMALATACLAGGVAVFAACRRASLGARRPVLARRLDELAGGGGQITSGVDLLEHPRSLGLLESGLAEIAVERAAALVSGLPAYRVAPARPLLLPAVAIATLASAIGLIFLAQLRLVEAVWLRFSDPFGDHPPYTAVVLRVTPGDVRVVYGQGIDIRAVVEGATSDRLELWLSPDGTTLERLPMFPEAEGEWRATVADVTLPGQYVVRSGRARSKRFRIDVITVPRITGVRFRVTPPAYTRRAAYEGPAPADGLSGLPGARVEVWAASNRPLSSGTLQLSGAKRSGGDHNLAPSSQSSTEVYGSFDVAADAKITIRVADSDGQPSLDTFSTSVRQLADDRPFVRLIEPRETSFATPDVQLPVVIAAEDDYGLERIQLFRSLNGSRSLPIELALGAIPFNEA